MEKLSRLLTAALLVTLLLAAPGSLAAKKKKKQPEKPGVIAGSVFQGVGFSARGARVTITPNPEQPDTSKKLKVLETTTDNRGEFAIRVPGGSMRYNVKVEAEGYQPAEKQVYVQSDQRVEQFFRLKPLPK